LKERVEPEAEKAAIIAMFVYLSIFNLFCWKLSKIVEKKHFVCSILIYEQKKFNLNFNYDKFYVYFRNGRKVISHRLCRVFFVGCMAMMAASAFFLLSLTVWQKMAYSVLVSGLITFMPQYIISTWDY
jgi:hypothetical protein